MNYHIDIQHACQATPPVSDLVLMEWATLALATCCETAELTLRLVNLDEITQLNSLYRKQNKATNVLAFPANIPTGVELDFPLLGDVIICPAVLEQESTTQHKSLESHWALIVIHGILHLLGYDHIEEDDATRMQTLEIQLLDTLGFDNPYKDHLEDSHIE